MTRWLTPMSAVTIAIAIVTAGLTQSVAAAPAAAPDWSDGACPDNVGITVVIDFQELGGGVNVRCAPGPASSGLDALDRADIAWEGTLRFPGFVCRVAGLPTPADEACANTPPADAYWSYWIAPRGGDWCYANVGPTSRTPPPGSVEGWSFALDKAAAEIPSPRFPVPDAVSGQSPNPIRGSDCTTAAASGTTGTTVRPASTTSSTSSSTTSTSTPSTPNSSTSTSSTPTSSTSTTVSRTSPPSSASGAGADIQTGGSTSVAGSTTVVAGPTTTVLDAEDEVVATTSTRPAEPSTVDEARGEVRAAVDDPPSPLFEVAEPAEVDAGSAELGTVDLSDDRRSDGGFGLSSVLGIAAIAGVAVAGILAARRRARPLRIET